MTEVFDEKYLELINMIALRKDTEIKIINFVVPYITIYGSNNKNIHHVTVYSNSLTMWTNGNNCMEEYVYYDKILVSTFFETLEKFRFDIYNDFKKLTNIVYDREYKINNVEKVCEKYKKKSSHVIYFNKFGFYR